MLLNVTSVDDVLVFGVPREFVRYNTQQTTAKLTRNTSCEVFSYGLAAYLLQSFVSYLAAGFGKQTTSSLS